MALLQCCLPCQTVFTCSSPCLVWKDCHLLSLFFPSKSYCQHFTLTLLEFTLESQSRLANFIIRQLCIQCCGKFHHQMSKHRFRHLHIQCGGKAHQQTCIVRWQGPSPDGYRCDEVVKPISSHSHAKLGSKSRYQISTHVTMWRDNSHCQMPTHAMSWWSPLSAWEARKSPWLTVCSWFEVFPKCQTQQMNESES